MKKVVLIAVSGVLMSIISCSEAQTSDQASGKKKQDNKHTEESSVSESSTLTDVGPEEFKTLIEEGEGIVLDVRTPEEVASNHIANASFINFYDPEFRQKIAVMQKSKPIYIYCKGGGRSSQAAQILIDSGFQKVYNLEGGIMAWEYAGNPLVEYKTVLDEGAKEMSVEGFNDFLSKHNVVLVDFHTKWCSPCKAMAPIVDEIELEFGEKAGVKRIDLDQSKEVGKQHKITGVPVFVVFKAGEEVWRRSGKVDKQILVEALNSALN